MLLFSLFFSLLLLSVLLLTAIWGVSYKPHVSFARCRHCNAVEWKSPWSHLTTLAQPFTGALPRSYVMCGGVPRAFFSLSHETCATFFHFFFLHFHVLWGNIGALCVCLPVLAALCKNATFRWMRGAIVWTLSVKVVALHIFVRCTLFFSFSSPFLMVLQLVQSTFIVDARPFLFACLFCSCVYIKRDDDCCLNL